MIDKLRLWLICLLAGKKVIVLNCEIKGTVYFQPGQKGLVANCHITDCMEKSREEKKIKHRKDIETLIIQENKKDSNP